jgi:hypothetical protein
MVIRIGLAATVDGAWRPGIGDPTVFGWLTVALYVAAAVLAGFAMRRSGRARSATDARFWLCVAVAMLLLAVNKQLDLQSWFTHAGRDLARQMGWYAYKRDLQFWFVVSVAVAACLGLGGLLWLVRRGGPGTWLAILGLIFLGCFIVLRASSFHHVHALLFRSVPGVNMNVVLEWTGILITGAGAVRGLHARRPG